VARLFADENFPFPVVEALRRMGHDVVTVADAGKAGQALTDKAILQLAGASQGAVVTLNRRHFVQLHTAEPTHAGIIVCSLDLDFEGQAARIDQAVAMQESLVGRLDCICLTAICLRAVTLFACKCALAPARSMSAIYASSSPRVPWIGRASGAGEISWNLAR
jgi:hypothetical protein